MLGESFAANRRRIVVRDRNGVYSGDRSVTGAVDGGDDFLAPGHSGGLGCKTVLFRAAGGVVHQYAIVAGDDSDHRVDDRLGMSSPGTIRFRVLQLVLAHCCRMLRLVRLDRLLLHPPITSATSGRRMAAIATRAKPTDRNGNLRLKKGQRNKVAKWKFLCANTTLPLCHYAPLSICHFALPANWGS